MEVGCERKPNANFQLEWKKTKGLPWSIENCCVNLRACYNCIAQSFANDIELVSGVGADWYNMQVNLSLKKVTQGIATEWTAPEKNVLDPKDIFHNVKTVLSQVKQLPNENNRDIIEEVHRLLLVLWFVWLTKIPKQETRNLYKEFGHHKDNSMIIEDYILKSCVNALPTNGNEWVLLATKNDLPIPESSNYFVACTHYTQDQDEKVIRSSLNQLESNVSDTEKALLNNLVACSYTKKSKTLLGLHYVRKAIGCCPSQSPLMKMLLYNVVVILKIMKRYDACIKAVKLLMERCQFASNESHFIGESIRFYILPTSNSDMFASVTNIPFCFDISEGYMIYLIAKFYLLNGDYRNAFSWFSKIKGVEKDNHVTLAQYYPTKFHFEAEMLFSAVTSDEMEMSEQSDDFIHYCAIHFKKANTKVSFEASKQCSISNLLCCIKTGSELFYCLSIELFKAKLLPPSSFEERLKNMIEELDHIAPIHKKETQLADASIKYKKCCQQYQNIMLALCTIKAKVLFNYAFLLALKSHHKKQQILELLHTALQFDLKNLEMRWNVTVLLHKIGKREEGIKTWCKTRGVNVNQPKSKLVQLRDEKQAVAQQEILPAKKEIIRRDVSILTELVEAFSV